MNTESKDRVILVDKNDNETGTMEKMEAHRKALLHRAISVFICNTRGEWLLQRRALNKYHSSGLWTNASCSHPFPGETCRDAANRRLMEEMGLKAPLKKLFHFTYKAELDNELTEHELDHVFLGITDDEPAINTNEVREWRYISYDKLFEEVNKTPEKYTFWFKKIYERVNRHVLDRFPELKVKA
ncbi:MAG: isopentenyl-diphosphate Delta-isomerase [Mariniphaga sp.]